MPVSTSSTFRWESSSLPLFVKTIWADGYRHVILRHEDPLAHDAANTPKSRSRLSSSCSLKSNKSCTKNERVNTQNLKVQTVKLLLAGTSSKNNETDTCGLYKEHQICDGALTVNVTPNQQVKTRNLNKEIHFWNNQLLCRKLPKHGQLKSTPRNEAGPSRLDMDTLASSIKFDTFNSNKTDTLSERVMVWLDLAHSGNVAGATVAKNEATHRVSTARTYSTRKMFSLDEKSEENWRDELPMYQTPSKPEDGCQKPMNNGDDSILKSPRQKNEVFVVDKQKRVVSKRREGKVPVELQSPRAKSVKGEMFRRQLHIFLPVLPKKSSDCGSTLTISSKGSSLLRNT